MFCGCYSSLVLMLDVWGQFPSTAWKEQPGFSWLLRVRDKKREEVEGLVVLVEGLVVLVEGLVVLVEGLVVLVEGLVVLVEGLVVLVEGLVVLVAHSAA